MITQLKVGDKISYLTIIQINKGTKSQRNNVVCQCCCGNIVKRRSDYLVRCNNIIGRISSCGCKHPNNHFQFDKHPNWKGYKTIPKTYWHSLRIAAKNRNIEFNITMEDMHNQLIKQNHKCNLSNILLIISSRRQYKTNTASIDRIDSSKGYTPDNIQWVHKDINLMKNKFPQEYFIETCHKISQSHQHLPNNTPFRQNHPQLLQPSHAPHPDINRGLMSQPPIL